MEKVEETIKYRLVCSTGIILNNPIIMVCVYSLFSREIYSDLKQL